MPFLPETQHIASTPRAPSSKGKASSSSDLSLCGAERWQREGQPGSLRSTGFTGSGSRSVTPGPGSTLESDVLLAKR